MDGKTFDLFSGGPEHDPLWLETVSGRSRARERIEFLSAQKPGQYFIFCAQTQTILDRIETFKGNSTGLDLSPALY